MPSKPLPTNSHTLERQLQHWGAALEWLEWELLLDDLRLCWVPLFDAVEHEGAQFAQEIQQLVVVLLDSHLQIHGRELTHVSVCVGVLRSEHWGYLEDALHVAHQHHLLVKLRGLC